MLRSVPKTARAARLSGKADGETYSYHTCQNKLIRRKPAPKQAGAVLVGLPVRRGEGRFSSVSCRKIQTRKGLKVTLILMGQHKSQ